MDINEKHKQPEIVPGRNETLLRALNDMAFVLLSDEDESFDNVMSRGVQPVADAIGIDRISVYVHVDRENIFKLKQLYLWRERVVKLDLDIIDVPENPATQRWRDTILCGKCLVQDVSKVSEVEAAFFNQFDVKAVCFVPVFIRGEYWGIISFGDHTNFRDFTNTEVETMRSAAHLCAHAISRRDMLQRILEHEEENKKSVTILENILDSIDAQIYVSDPKTGELLFVNKHMKTFFGKETEDLVGTYCYKVFRGIDTICDFCPCPMLSDNPERTIVWEDYIESLDRYTMHSDCYIDWPGRGKVHLQHTVDITDIKKAEEQLIKAKEAAELSSNYKTDFLARMSHEIRTPMNAIIGMTELALRDENPDAKIKHILTVKQAGSNLLAIINDILDFSKIESGKMEIITGEYSVSSLLDDVISIIRMRVVDSQVRFVVKVDSSIPRTLYGDETKLRQALLNLLSNAVKYTERGFVSLGVYLQPAERASARGAEEISCHSEEIMLTFEIADSGIGIKQEDMDKLFSDFTQLDIERNKGIEGVGLGLIITQSIVSAMGGEISVKSKYNKGSTFTVTIPQSYDTRETLASVHQPDKHKILVFERRTAYADSITYAAENLGVDCTLVATGTELFEAMDTQSFDFLFISYMLYKKNGDTITKFGKNTKVYILVEFGEGISDKNLDVLSMPIYVVHLANVLNGEHTGFSYTAELPKTKFTAPNARVLVVDDINANLKVAQGLLSMYNLHVDLRNNARAAIEAVKSAVGNAESYDLIFMDHKMPDVDGVEATVSIRALAEKTGNLYYRDVPIIALTANAVSGIMEMFLENGFNDFLPKPIDLARLNATLEKWIPYDKQITRVDLQK